MSDLLVRTLGELILIKKGKKPASVATNRRNEADRPYLLIESFGGNYKSFTDDSSCPYSSREDTLLVWDGERCGLTSTGHEGYIGSTLASIRKSTGDLEPSYLYHFLVSKQKEIRNSAEGTGVPHVSRRSLEDLEIVVPPLPEQKKIAEILSGIDSDIQTHSTRLRVLQNIQNALFSEMPRKEEATEGALLGDIISAINSGWSPVCPPKARVGDEPAILKTTAITWEGYRPEENKALPSELPSKDEAVVKSGDILCTRKGPRDRVGVVCYVSETPPNLMVPDTAFRIRTLEGIDPHYISLILGSKEVQEEWNRKKVGLAEAQVNINYGILKETFVPLPSREKQLLLVNAITSIRERIKQENSKLRALQVLKSSLASDLLSGRKRVTI